jgi:ankyrin repeat protein
MTQEEPTQVPASQPVKPRRWPRRAVWLVALVLVIGGWWLLSGFKEVPSLDPLSGAVMQNDTTRIRVLLTLGFSPDGYKSERTPLQRAALYGRIDIAALLLAHGAHPDLCGTAAKPDMFNQSPLWWAITRDDLPLAQVLVRGGANVRVSTGDRWSPLYAAVTAPGYDKQLPSQMITFLIASGADVNTTDHGVSYLWLACDERRPGWVRQMLALSADPNIRCTSATRSSNSIITKEETALHRAVDVCPDAVAPLVEHGANVNARTDRGDTPLHYAARYAAAIAHYLLAHGADPTARNHAGQTPLMIARNRKDTGLVQAMLKAQAAYHP